jgi:hypothetical protein
MHIVIRPGRSFHLCRVAQRSAMREISDARRSRDNQRNFKRRVSHSPSETLAFFLPSSPVIARRHRPRSQTSCHARAVKEIIGIPSWPLGVPIPSTPPFCFSPETIGTFGWTRLLNAATKVCQSMFSIITYQ